MGVIKNFTVNRHQVWNVHQIYIDGTFVYRGKTYGFQATTVYKDHLWQNSQLDISSVDILNVMSDASQKICRPELKEETTKYVAGWRFNQKDEFDRLLKESMDENKIKHEEFIKNLKAVIKNCEDQLATDYANNTLNPYPIWIGLRHYMWQIDRDHHLGIIS